MSLRNRILFGHEVYNRFELSINSCIREAQVFQFVSHIVDSYSKLFTIRPKLLTSNLHRDKHISFKILSKILFTKLDTIYSQPRQHVTTILLRYVLYNRSN